MQKNSFLISDITIGIVTYNSKDLIVECLNSIFNSADLPAEIIIVDNGSNDETVEQVRQYQFGPVRHQTIINTENNIGLARHKVILSSKTKLVAFIDSDCIAPRNWLIQLLSGLNQQNPSDLLAVCGPNRLPENSAFKRAANSAMEYPWGHGYSPQAWAPEQLTLTTHAPTTNALYIKESVLKVGNFDISLATVGEDLELGLRAQNKGYKCYLLPKPIVMNDSANTLGEWAERMYKFGKVQAPLKLTHRSSKNHSILWLYGAVFLILLGFALATITPFALVYFSLLCYGLIKISHKHRSYLIGFLSAAFILVTHICYGLGVIKGVITGENN